MPKAHFLAHLALKMKRQSEVLLWVQNPLATSVQCQEDYIGRPSRVSRRVSIRQVHRNVLCRVLILVQRALDAAAFDRRGLEGACNKRKRSEMI